MKHDRLLLLFRISDVRRDNNTLQQDHSVVAQPVSIVLDYRTTHLATPVLSLCPSFHPQFDFSVDGHLPFLDRFQQVCGYSFQESFR